MSQPILQIRGLVKRFGGVVATDSLDFDVRRDEVHAVIGPNGAGKTTLVNQLVGEIGPDAGSIVFEGADITRLPTYRRARLGLSRSYQITSVFPEFTALENVALAAQARDGHSFGAWRPAITEVRLSEPAAAALGEVGLTGRMNQPAASLAHGERRQLEIAMALVSKPKLLLLDEPTAGMAPRERNDLIALTKRLVVERGISVLFTEHSMDVVFAYADRILVMARGALIADGSAEAIRDNPEVQQVYLGTGKTLTRAGAHP